ncbi:hypothetical protein SLW70_01805 [Flavobacterium sp. NG2]|uniref:hypothetical protein n=1 Tax=Flavobacterium sp. NG2 TaxID=3097547 RepID=UPI002A7F6101|nr:hypothetical protein [Flavobacterium sp. NG2]WPR71887.1 hypothetical protein SLW70_01805 [Flavobacterium sp. NG2]
MKPNFKILGVLIGLLLFSCTEDGIVNETEMTTTPIQNTAKPSRGVSEKLWNFDSLNEWEDATQVGDKNYSIENGILTMFTNANSWDRTKIKSAATYTTGAYSWRVYVPAMGIGDKASIGAFLYNDDTHELDFEIGYGQQSVRELLNASSDDLLVYTTSQANPFRSEARKIKREQWYTLSIELTLNSKNKYIANWKIDGNSIQTLQLNYGTRENFKIFCSVENLQFIGDHIPNSQNYALFDFVEYRGN